MNEADSSQNLWGAQEQQQPRLRRRGTRANIATACDQCHRCKIRCNGSRPSCERCQKDDATCTYSLGKPLGKPPKNGRGPPPPPTQPQSNMPPPVPQVSVYGHLRSHSHSTSHTDSGQDGNAGYVMTGAQKSTSMLATINDNVAYTGKESTQGGGGEDGEPNSGSSMDIEHDFPSPNPLMPSFERSEQYLSHDESHSLLWATEDNFFEGAGSVEGMNLDFLASDFGPNSWTISKSKEDTSSTPLTLEITMKNNGGSKPQLISPPESLPSATLSHNQGSSAEQVQTAICLDIENLGAASAATPSREDNRNKESYQHLPLLLETTLRLYFQTPSITQAPISEALRLAKQGLQAIHHCLRRFSLLPHAQAPSEPSSHESSPPELEPASTSSESSSILACIILIERVLFCYDSLLKPRSGPGNVSSPYASSPAPSSTSISNPTASSSSTHHRIQPVFIGDFEVESKASWKMILDAVVTAEKQEARNTVSKLEDWASNLVRKGKNEGRLAMTFLEQLKRKFHD